MPCTLMKIKKKYHAGTMHDIVVSDGKIGHSTKMGCRFVMIGTC